MVLRMSSKKVFIFFLEGLMRRFPSGYRRTFCPRKSKPFHMRDDCLRRRKLKPSFSQKLLNQGFDISFQQLFRFAGDDEVIRITDEIHRGILASEGLDRPSRRIFFLQDSFQSIQRTCWRALGK